MQKYYPMYKCASEIVEKLKALNRATQINVHEKQHNKQSQINMKQ